MYVDMAKSWLKRHVRQGLRQGIPNLWTYNREPEHW